MVRLLSLLLPSLPAAVGSAVFSALPLASRILDTLSAFATVPSPPTPLSRAGGGRSIAHGPPVSPVAVGPWPHWVALFRYRPRPQCVPLLPTSPAAFPALSLLSPASQDPTRQVSRLHPSNSGPPSSASTVSPSRDSTVFSISTPTCANMHENTNRKETSVAKVKAPLLSFGASGKLGDAIVYFPWKGINAVRTYVIPANPKSGPQITQRGHLEDSVDGWHENAYTDADRIAWNRFAGTLADIMSGFNAMIRTSIAAYIAGSLWRLISDVQVDTPTINGFDVDVENSVAGYVLQARIGTSKTHFPTTVALVDDADGTYSLTWAGGGSGVDYYVYLEDQRAGVWYRVSGIYHVKSA